MADLRFLYVYKRDMTRYFRFKTQLLSSLLQPILWLTFFGMAMAGNFDRILPASPVISGVLNVDYLTFMCAGIIAVTILFTNIFGGFILLFDKNWGLLREVVASPMPRRNLIIGIALSGVTKSLIQATIILVYGLALGVTFFEGKSFLNILLSLGGILLFISVFAVSFLCISSSIALRMDSPEGFQGITTLLTMPLFFVSNALYPTESFPPFLHDLSGINPLTHLINGIRYFAIGDNFSAIGLDFAYTTNDILFSFGFLVVFAMITFTIALKTVERVVVT
ncbi:multidrug ABC transporter permease [Methanoplanus sp. FWC-SCC4]|uniref:Multidrug ABC transporter permease n=1 Tax=Methanochimaera problematica TaxID=2609417 RepID=A0AA97FF29_9EURY|nr:ABC transporter permease [Methanoplanus sp. FWC-SCC4]WOF17014.1 multidrug ABC transporter permease [Methanoplanus sp. FWC-SCC4]